MVAIRHRDGVVGHGIIASDLKSLSAMRVHGVPISLYLQARHALVACTEPRPREGGKGEGAHSLIRGGEREGSGAHIHSLGTLGA